MTETAQIKESDSWLETFEALEHAKEDSPSWLVPFRKAGLAQYAKTGLPTLSDEDWRFTNIDPIRNTAFTPSTAPRSLDSAALDGISYPFKKENAIRLVFLDGHFLKDLSDQSGLPDEVTALSIKEAVEQEGLGLEQHLGQYTYQNDNPFAALNAAFFQDGFYLHIPKNLQIETPIQIIHLASGTDAQASFARFLIRAEKFSKCTILESHQAINDGVYLNAPTTEFVVEDEANVEHIKVQDESKQAFHVASVYARVGRAAHFHSHYLSTGGRISRNNIRTKLDGEGLECVLNGLYLADGDQLSDNHMIVDHSKPHCDSHEYFNGILDDKARGVFHGRILVQQIAQKTDAKQTNKNLLLSNDATADTKPQLEIYADDVKCTHGATIGQLDDEAIYYLRTRGVPKAVAQQMLVHAFAGEIIDRIQHDVIREELDETVWAHLENSLIFNHLQRHNSNITHTMQNQTPTELTRDVEAAIVPAGDKVTLVKGETAHITQELGGSFTVVVNGNMFRIQGKDADALGREVTESRIKAAMEGDVATPEEVETQVWEQMKTCFDPEIPVNVVDLGLIYDCVVTPEKDCYHVLVKMTLTAPGCGMGPVIQQDVQNKIMCIEDVSQADVELVWEPQWNQGMMTEAAKLQLGLM